MPALTPEEKAQGGRMLVVDDIEANVRLLSRILKNAGHEISTAQSGQEALEKVLSEPPDVVLLDVMMPGMDGFEVCRRLRADPQTSTLPIVMVTALQETEDRVKALEAGADDFLTKPVDSVEVVARVRSLLRVKRGRDELEKSYADLRRAESLRDDLSEMLVHDLRTPLTTLLGPLEMLEGEQFGPLNETQREVASMSARSGYRLLYLVNELLDISKMEGGRMTLQPREVDLRKTSEEAIEQVAVVHSANQSRIAIEYSNDVPPIIADEDLLRRVLINLLGNAIKFTPRDGYITLGIELQDNDILMWVRDTGEGVPAADQERIFEKFGQVESRKAGRKMSTGLGLTFCKLAVEAHGGRIWLESAPGQGSTFFFTLPLGA
jgi:two-component system sensor histidine kinase/response regulator